MCPVYFLVQKPAQQKSSEDDSVSAFPSTSVLPATKRKHLKEKTLNSEVGDRDDAIVHHNSPILMTVYKDPNTLGQKICVNVNLPSGATDIIFSLLVSGPVTSTATVTYEWPRIMHTVEGLFNSEIKRKTACLPPYIVALQSELENHRSNIQDTPRGSIELTLPIPVQTDPGTVSYKNGKTPNGIIVLIANLSAFHGSYTMKKTELECPFQDF